MTPDLADLYARFHLFRRIKDHTLALATAQEIAAGLGADHPGIDHQGRTCLAVGPGGVKCQRPAGHRSDRHSWQ